MTVAGGPEEPFLARVIDIVGGVDDTHIVHLEVIDLPGQVIDELTQATSLRTEVLTPPRRSPITSSTDEARSCRAPSSTFEAEAAAAPTGAAQELAEKGAARG